jgi:hypothetical protein
MSDELPQAESLLWFTDRSAFTDGVAFCPRFRYLNRHAGETGYGFEPLAQSIPLATGTYQHRIVERVLRRIIGGEDLSDEIIRTAVRASLQDYADLVERRGIAFIEGEGQEAAYILEEQSCLIEGLGWVFGLYVLPQILKEYKILSVEKEYAAILDCTCGLGELNGHMRDHVARGCQGTALSSRPDFLGERLSDGSLCYFEIKTTGDAGKAWAESWETAIQFCSTRVPIEEELGREISHSWVYGFWKGRRDREKDWEGNYTGPRKQQSKLCYLFHREANPPFCDEDWQPSFYYYSEDGKRHQLSKKKGEAYEKAPVWVQKFPNQPPEWSAVEYWVKWLGPEGLSDLIVPVGPIPRKDQQISSFIRELRSEERRWREGLWKLYDLDARWDSENFQQNLDEIFPRSYACSRRFGKPCPYIPVCFYQEAWMSPTENGYVPRRPHHQYELEQAVARGLLVEEGLAEQEEE